MLSWLPFSNHATERQADIQTDRQTGSDPSYQHPFACRLRETRGDKRETQSQRGGRGRCSWGGRGGAGQGQRCRMGLVRAVSLSVAYLMGLE